MNTDNRHTPWGYSDSAKEVAPGIVWVTTPSHGGVFVSEARRLIMLVSLRGFVPWAGEGWYEEDCDWAIVVLAWPSLFKPRDLFYAVGAVSGQGIRYYSERGADITGYWLTAEGRQARSMAEEWTTRAEVAS